MSDNNLYAVEVNDVKRTATGIRATVKWNDGLVTDFHAAPTDTMEYGRILYEQLDSGAWGVVAPYTEEEKKEAIEQGNKAVLSSLESYASSITRPLAEEKDLGIISDDDLARYKAWAIYRQKLRKTDLSVDKPDWPEKPE